MHGNNKEKKVSGFKNFMLLNSTGSCSETILTTPNNRAGISNLIVILKTISAMKLSLFLSKPSSSERFIIIISQFKPQ